MKFTEAQLEAAIIQLLETEGYPYLPGETIPRQPQDDGPPPGAEVAPHARDGPHRCLRYGRARGGHKGGDGRGR